MRDDLTGRELKKGETLYNEGDIGDCAYLIESGSVSLSIQGSAGRELRGIHYSGDFLGELALIGQRIRTATAIAREDSRVKIVRRQDIDRRVAGTDPLVQEFLNAMLSDLRNMLINKWDMSKSSAEGLAMAERELKEVQSITRALEKREFVLYYQPIIRLADMQVVGSEALIRWNRPEYGLMPPAEFIPLAENSGAIVEIGRWVIEQACQDLAAMVFSDKVRQEGAHFVSVNISGRQLSDGELSDVVARALEGAQLRPAQLKLEVTESELAQSIQAAMDLLNRLKNLGVTVALDDFGTGQSSLEYLHRFPADTLKLDRSFVDAIHDDRIAMTIVRTIAELARNLEMDVVAEGVESMQVAGTLRDMGVDFAQGYYFARPMTLPAMQKYLEHHAAGVQA